MSGLRALLSLPEGKSIKLTGQAEEFDRAFREKITGVNQKLRLVAAQANRSELQPLEGQRARLFEAYQKASVQLERVDPSKAGQTIQRVMAAVDSVDRKAAEVADGAMAGHDAWLDRESEFDDALVQIGELEEANHAKAAVLRKLSNAIRSRVNDCKYREAIAALDQMLPKLGEIYQQHQQSDESGQVSPAAEGDEPARVLKAGPAKRFRLQVGDDTSGEEPEADAAREGLTVLIRDAETGEAVEGAVVEISDQSDTSSANGLATVELPVGVHDYVVAADGYATVEETVEIIAGDNPEIVVELSPQADAREGLTILVRDQQSGDSIEGAEVTVGDQSDTSSAHGLATVELPVGAHDYEVLSDGYDPVGGSLEIVAGDNPELVVEMYGVDVPREGLTVLVQDAETGEAVEGVAVTVGHQSDVTSSHGLATVELPAGTHRFEATADNFETASGDVEVVEGDNPELVIQLTPGEGGDDGGSEEDGDLTDELSDAERFVGAWDQALGDVADQVERLRSAMADSQEFGTEAVRRGLATVVNKFPDLDLTKLVKAAKANDRVAYETTLEQTAREVREARDLLANGPLLSTIDENPYVTTNVHATVTNVLDDIVAELGI